jgi:hypothetical protein
MNRERNEIVSLSGLRPRAFTAWQIPLLYYLAYAGCVFLNTFLVPDATVSLRAGFIALLFVFLCVSSAWIMNPRRRPPEHTGGQTEANLVAWAFRLALPSVVVLIILKWAILVQHYGSLHQIFAQAFAVRMESMGHDGPLLEALSGYGVSLVFALLPLALSVWVVRPGRQALLRIVLCIVLIFLNDLSTFARMGTLWALLTCFSAIVLFRVESHFTRKRIVLIALIGFAVMGLPRMFRHGLFSPSGMSVLTTEGGLLSGAAVSAVVEGATVTIVDYSSGLSAFSTFLQKDEESTSGVRTFTPLWRLANRIGIGDSGKYITTIDEPAENISSDYNLYTVLRDFYQDFGIIGVALAGVLFGLAYGAMFSSKGLIGKAITMYMTAWILYTPFYNAFSFGMFLIPFAILVATYFLFRLPGTRRTMEAV